MIYFRVRNLDHAGATLSTFEDLPELAYSFVLSDMSDASWTIPLSHPSLTRDGFAPKATDYKLDISDNNATWTPVQGGICGPVGLKGGDQSVKVTGYDWLAYFKQPYPFDYVTAYASLATTDLIKNQNPLSMQALVQMIVDSVSADIGVTATFVASGNWSTQLTYPIYWSDTTELLDHLRAIGDMNAPRGFEFTMGQGKVLRLSSPTVTPANGAASANFLYVTGTNGLLDIDWGNTGPMATKSVGLYSGQKYAYSDWPASTALYRSWLELFSVRENIKEVSEITALTAGQAYLHRFPQKNLTVTIKPDEVDPNSETAWFYNRCGELVTVDSEDYFLPYHRIQATFKITKQDFKLDNGTWTCDLSLDQVYNA